LPEKPQPGDFIIDFTHGMNKEPESVNHKRWVERLDHISKSWGAQGDNSMWGAPTDEVMNYALAAREAKVAVCAWKLTVNTPDTLPGSALTLKISGLSEKTASKRLKAARFTAKAIRHGSRRQSSVSWARPCRRRDCAAFTPAKSRT
jgi:hypothetical protein